MVVGFLTETTRSDSQYHYLTRTQWVNDMVTSRFRKDVRRLRLESQLPKLLPGLYSLLRSPLSFVGV